MKKIFSIFTCFIMILVFVRSSLTIKAADWITAELYGDTSASVSCKPKKSGSDSATAYADINNAVGNVMITVSTGYSNNCSKSSGGGSVYATFNGVNYSASGSTIVFDVGQIPVSGTVAIHLSCSVNNRCENSDTVSASASVLSVKFKKPDTPVIVTDIPANRNYNYQDSLSFSISAIGADPLSYQWYKNGVAIAGATSPSLNLGVQTTLTNNNTSIKCVVTNYLGSATSQTCVLTANVGTFKPSISASSLTLLFRPSVNIDKISI